MRVCLVVAAFVGAGIGAGCSGGQPFVPGDDVGGGKDSQDTPADSGVDDVTLDGPAPPVDAGPPCGNGRLDPGEKCDPGATSGPAACPVTCDDVDHCTEDSLSGSAAECSAFCRHRPIEPCCGNNLLEPGEQCDDGNSTAWDACNAQCNLPGGHLLLTEVITSPPEAESFELFNPSDSAVALEKIYVADRVDYYLITTGAIPGVASDFAVRFPAGAQILPGEYVTVALDGQAFATTFGSAADYEIKSTDATPDMVAATEKSLGGSAGLTDSGEMLVLFSWNGSADLVEDIDYVAWKDGAQVFKSTQCVDGVDADDSTSCYADDTPEASQAGVEAPSKGGSIHRCNYLEGNEEKQGGNGLFGHDETSEDLASTWKLNLSNAADRTPGGPAPAGFCP